MAETLFEKYEGYATANSYTTIWQNRWYFQTFIARQSYPLTHIKLVLQRYTSWGTEDYGTNTLAIHATDENGMPTGDPLCSVTLEPSAFPYRQFQWSDISLGDGTALVEGTRYAIVLHRANDGNGNSQLGWYDYWSETSDPFPDGALGMSYNNADWETWDDVDYWDDALFQTDHEQFLGLAAADSDYYAWADDYLWESFIVKESHSLTSVELPLYKDADATGTYTVSIHPCRTDGLPTETVLCSATLNIDELPEWSPELIWKRIAFESPTNLTVGLRYAIVLASDRIWPDTSDTVGWFYDYMVDGYADGENGDYYPGDGFYRNDGEDMLFREYGEVGTFVTKTLDASYTAVLETDAEVPNRPANYDPTKIWDEGTGQWTDNPDYKHGGGGRFNQQLVVINDKGNIFFEALT